MRILYALAGAFILIIVDLLVNLLAAAIQQQAFGNGFTTRSTAWLAGLAIAGALLGLLVEWSYIYKHRQSKRKN